MWQAGSGFTEHQNIQGIWASSPLACSFGPWTSSSISIPGPLQLVREVCFREVPKIAKLVPGSCKFLVVLRQSSGLSLTLWQGSQRRQLDTDFRKIRNSRHLSAVCARLTRKPAQEAEHACMFSLLPIACASGLLGIELFCLGQVHVPTWGNEEPEGKTGKILAISLPKATMLLRIIDLGVGVGNLELR